MCELCFLFVQNPFFKTTKTLFTTISFVLHTTHNLLFPLLLLLPLLVQGRVHQLLQQLTVTRNVTLACTSCDVQPIHPQPTFFSVQQTGDPAIKPRQLLRPLDGTDRQFPPRLILAQRRPHAFQPLQQTPRKITGRDTVVVGQGHFAMSGSSWSRKIEIVRSQTLPTTLSSSSRSSTIHSITIIQEEFGAILMSEEPYYATVSKGIFGKIAAGPSVDDLLANALELLCALVGYAPRLIHSTIDTLVDCLGLALALPLDNKSGSSGGSGSNGGGGSGHNNKKKINKKNWKNKSSSGRSRRQRRRGGKRDSAARRERLLKQSNAGRNSHQHNNERKGSVVRATRRGPRRGSMQTLIDMSSNNGILGNSSI